MKRKAAKELLKNNDVRRWYENLSRGSKLNADIRLRRLNLFCHTVNTTPAKLVSLGKKDVIEIETPQETRSHPEQVKANMIKNLDTFRTVQMWCYQDSADALQSIKEENLTPEQQLQIRIMPVQKDGSQAVPTLLL